MYLVLPSYVCYKPIAPYAENNHYVNIEYGLAEGLHDPVFASEDDFSLKESPCHISSYESVVDINNYKYYENDDMIRTRVKTFYNELIRQHKNENHVILLACHKCICNVLLEIITGSFRDMGDPYEMGKLTTVDENGEILWIN